MYIIQNFIKFNIYKKSREAFILKNKNIIKPVDADFLNNKTKVLF